jgi:hypothetical protein
VKQRIASSLVVGLVVAVVVAVYADSARHAALAANAAKAHQSLAAVLTDGVIILTLVVAFIVFVIGLIVSGTDARRRQRAAVTTRRSYAGTRR